MELSIVIPVYNEGRKVDADILMADRFLRGQQMKGEILLSDDGSTDDTMEIPDEVVRELNTPIHLIKNKAHRGKGHTVRSGILKARGQIILFVDSGACIPYEDISKGIELVRSGACNIAHGSRFLPESRIVRKQRWHRRTLSLVFRRFIHYFANIPGYLTDTQCGLKIYQKEVARHLYRDSFTDGFMFDIEIILSALKAGYVIREFPVRWTSDPDSRLPVFKTFLQMIPELYRIRKL